MHDQHIGSGFVNAPGQTARVFQFVITQDGIEGDEHATVVTVGLFAKPLDVAQRVGGGGPGAKGGSADVDGIRAVLKSGNAYVGVARRGQQFEVMRL